VSPVTDACEDFYEVFEKTGARSEVAVALLVLASRIERASTFSASNAENFGHELACALKHVLDHASFNVNGDIKADVEVRNE
jgi:hypothetical protein